MRSLRYARAPSEGFLSLLLDGLLAPLRDPWVVSGLPLDLQLREGDRAALYCGLTRLVQVHLCARGVLVEAAQSYTRQPCARVLMRPWRTDEQGFREALAAYLRDVEVNPRFIGREGQVQCGWMRLGEPWIALDREAVIGGGLVADPVLEAAVFEVRTLGRAWREVRGPRAANEVDLLGLDPDGRLVVAELKWGGAADLYLAPLQALRYAVEWSRKIEALREDLGRFILAKQRLGLLPADLPAPTGALRVAVAWGDEPPSREVLRRLHAVRAVAERYLPAGLETVELWHMPGGTPVRIPPPTG